MISEQINRLKATYENGDDNIGSDFIRPCLKECKRYRRGTAYFSSSSLKSYADALNHIVDDNVKIEILCSPVINDEGLLRTLHENITEEERLNTIQKYQEDFIKKAITKFKEDPDSRGRERLALLAYLIANELLVIKTAIRKSVGWPNPWPTEEEVDKFAQLYHVKRGYFVFEDDKKIAFDGSFNETDSGHKHNTETANVYKNWHERDEFRARNIIEKVDRDWDEVNPNLHIRPLSKELIALIKESAPPKRPHWAPEKPHMPIDSIESNPNNNDSYINKLWDHQKIAVDEFLTHKNGILEMATGTGKTVTSLAIARRLIEEDFVSTIIVSTFGNDLLSQWCENIQKWIDQSGSEKLHNLRIARRFGDYDELLSFLNSPKDALLVISREPERLHRLFNDSNIDWTKTLIIHDEIHGLGSPEIVKKLTGMQNKIAYRLGLSATPEREYDEIGRNFITHEVGDVIYQFPLEKAIQEGILCEFDYIQLPFELTQEDKENRKNVYARKAAAEREGSPWSQERLFTELSKVVKKATLKPTVLRHFLNKHPNAIESSIVFVEDTEQGDKISSVLREFTHKYKSYYSGTDSIYINMLAKNQIDSLVACQRLNEGVDIRELNTVFLVASDKARLTTIQRIGRCLRINPSNPKKRAKVIDFVLQSSAIDNEETADQERANWLNNVALSRRLE